MKFTELLKMKSLDNFGNRSPLIAFLGDSVTQGCFEIYRDGELIRTVFDSPNGYAEKTKSILNMMYPETSVSMLNAGINGGTAKNAVMRLERDVLVHKPDLVVVCFGLNDANDEVEGREEYLANLKTIFTELKKSGTEVVFMTPNMMNTYTDCSVTDEVAVQLAEMFAEKQKNGYFDSFIEGAKKLCKEENIPVCDCYALWKKMYASGVDTTRLLSNRLNHPTRDMHWLFAWELIKTMINN